MKGSWIDYLRGYVWVKLIGGEPEKFLNAVTTEQIMLWNISFTPEGKLAFGVSIPDFFRLRPILRLNGSRTRILSRHGLPFKLARFAQGKFLPGACSLS